MVRRGHRNATGSVSALMYEGIVCASGQVKTYARAQAPPSWTAVTTPVWRDMSNLPSRHALAFARQGACDNNSRGRYPQLSESARQGRRND